MASKLLDSVRYVSFCPLHIASEALHNTLYLSNLIGRPELIIITISTACLLNLTLTEPSPKCNT